MAANRETVSVGTCERNGTLVCGVVDPRQSCDTGSWIPSHTLEVDFGHIHRFCSANLSPDRIVIGRCGRDGPCANRAERCADPTSFLPWDPDCRITEDRGTLGNHTTYGRCGLNRCVWSPSDCAAGEVYTREDPSCTADRVVVGACRDGGGHGYCAVSPETCTNSDGTPGLYYDHASFSEQFGTNCYLADLSGTKGQAPPSFAPVEIPTAFPTWDPFSVATPSMGGSTITITTTNQPAGNGLSQGALIGISVGATIAVGFGVGYTASRISSGVHDDRLPQAIEMGSDHEIDVDSDSSISTVSEHGLDYEIDVDSDSSFSTVSERFPV